MTHTATSIYVITDLLVAATPVRIYHVYHAMIFSVMYLIFSIIYDAGGGTNALNQPYIYEMLDWSEDIGTAALYSVLTILVGVPVLWLVVYALYALRTFIYGKLYGHGDGMVNTDSTEMDEGGQQNPAHDVSA